MNEKKLHCFITVAECENMSRAADRLYIAQPALSKIIIGIEQELGYSLFDRVGKRIVLNQNGEVLYKYAKRILNEYDNVRNALGEQNRRRIEPLHIGLAASSQLLTLMLSEFQKIQGNENVEVRIMASYPLDFAKDQIDLMIDAELAGEVAERSSADRSSADRKGNASKQYLLTESILLAYPKGHPLQVKKRISFQDTMEYPYVLPSENTCMGRILTEFFRTRSESVSIDSMTVNNSYLQCELVAQGLGISLIPEKSWVYAKQLQGLELREIEDMDLKRNIFFRYHPDRYQSAIMRRFGGFLKEFYQILQEQPGRNQ